MPLFHVTPRRLDDDQVARVRDPATGQVIPEEGATVEWSTYWERRLQDGEVDRAEPADEADDSSVPPPADRRTRRAPSTTAPAASAENKD